MSIHPVMQRLADKLKRTDLPAFVPGDQIRVQVKIKEGDKERLQAFEGLVIAINNGPQGTFTVRKMSFGQGVERIFPFNSKVIDKIEKIRSYKVRRAKLFYIRGLRGKAARLKEVDRVTGKVRPKQTSTSATKPRLRPGLFFAGTLHYLRAQSADGSHAAGARRSYTDSMTKVPVCGWKLERGCARRGALRIAGLDEVGRGPMFGPVVAAAVILPQRLPLARPDRFQTAHRKAAQRIRCGDPRLRHGLGDCGGGRGDDRPHQHPPGVAAGDAHGCGAAGACRPDYLLIDGRDTIDWPMPAAGSRFRAMRRSLSIAAASVLAKVHRDRLLVELDVVYPGYGLARHKGYCSPEHMEALARLGPTPLHRRSFGPVAQMAMEFD